MDAYRGLHEFGRDRAHFGEDATAWTGWWTWPVPHGRGARLFPGDVMTDQPMAGVLAAELIREKSWRRPRDELPFAVAVGIDSFIEERKGAGPLVRAWAAGANERGGSPGSARPCMLRRSPRRPS